MFLLILLRICIVAIASFVVWSSVTGLGALFSSIAVPVMFAAAALDLSKYVAVSFAYQYWDDLGIIERFSVFTFVAVLMVFTSAGVFSYLGQNYQKSYSNVDLVSSERVDTEKQLAAVTLRIAELERQVTALPSNLVSARIKLMKAYDVERNPLIAKRAELELKLLNLTAKEKAQSVHAGPITYLAKVFSTTVENASTVVVAALTLCLDPFALFLTVMMNKLTLIVRRGKKQNLTYSTVEQEVQEEIKESTPDNSVNNYTMVTPPKSDFSYFVETTPTSKVSKKRRVWNIKTAPLKNPKAKSAATAPPAAETTTPTLLNDSEISAAPPTATSSPVAGLAKLVITENQTSTLM